MQFPPGNLIVDALIENREVTMLAQADVITLERGETTTAHSFRMLTVDFPVPGTLLSVVGIVADGSTAEVATIGSEGFVEVDAALHHTIARRTSICQFPGQVIRVPIADFMQGLYEKSPFSDQVYHSVRTRLFITEQLRLCALRHPTGLRLARWLLLASYRIKSETLSATHEMLAGLLGTRRASVTIAATQLHATGAIRYSQGTITIQDRIALEASSCECYTVCREALEEDVTSR